MLFLPVLIYQLEKHQILESPGKRKVHHIHVPSMGGIGIFLGFIFAIILWWPQHLLASYRLFLGAVILMFIIGLKDDLIPLKAWQKLVSQFIPVLIILFSANGLIGSFYDFMGIGEIPVFLSILFTIFTIIVIVNSINLIDGADGLAATIGFSTILLLGVWFYLAGFPDYAIIAWSFAGALLAFIFFNWHPAKIFMGDTGALVIGLIVAFLIVQFLNANYTLLPDNPYRLNAISVSISLLFVPLFDTIRVFTIRLINRKSPFRADKNHIHHIFMRLGYSHAQLTLVLISINFLFIFVAVISSRFSEEISLLFILALSLVLSFVVEYLIVKSIADMKGSDKKSVLKLIKSSKNSQSKAS